MKDRQAYQETELEVELQQIEDEIGELEGLHLAFQRPMPDLFPTVKSERNFPLGTMIDRNSFPPEILKDLTVSRNSIHLCIVFLHSLMHFTHDILHRCLGVFILQFYKDLDARMEAIRLQDKGWRYSKAGDSAAIKEVYDRIEADAALGEAEEAAERAAGGGGYSGSGKSGGKFSTNKFGGSGGTGGGVYSGTKSGKWTPKGSNTNTISTADPSSQTTRSTSAPVPGSSSTVKPEIPRRVWAKKGDLGGGYRGYGEVVGSTNDASDASTKQISLGV